MKRELETISNFKISNARNISSGGPYDDCKTQAKRWQSYEDIIGRKAGQLGKGGKSP